MSEIPTSTALVLSDEDYKASLERHKERVGKGHISAWRDTDTLKNDNWDVPGGKVEKDTLGDRDVQEVAVALLEEKMLDLQDAGLDSPANTQAYNELCDIRDMLAGLDASYDGTDMYFDAVELSRKFKTEGDQDKADVAALAASYIQHVGRRINEGTEGKAADIRGKDIRTSNIGDIVKEHNERVSQNTGRRQAV